VPIARATSTSAGVAVTAWIDASSKTGFGASAEGDAATATLAELGGGALAADEAAVACVLGGFVSGVPRP
jgi:hypothetical protein